MIEGQLVRVVAPHFVAGLVMQDGVCTEAAPILNWCLGRDGDQLRAYFRRKRWRAGVLPARASRLERSVKAQPGIIRRNPA